MIGEEVVSQGTAKENCQIVRSDVKVKIIQREADLLKELQLLQLGELIREEGVSKCTAKETHIIAGSYVKVNNNTGGAKFMKGTSA